MLSDKQVVTGEMYSYPIDGENRMGVLGVITRPIKDVRWCRMDNGDNITLDNFKVVAMMVDERDGAPRTQTRPIVEKSSSSNSVSEKDVTTLMTPQTDSEGNPLLQPDIGNNEENNEENSLVISPEKFKQLQDANNPIVPLLKKAKTTEVILNINLPVQLIDKELFDLIERSFNESKDTIFQFIMNNISDGVLKDVLMKQVEEYYGKKQE